MRKYLAAGVVGLALLAGQAIASEDAMLKAGDRIGPTGAAAGHLVGSPMLYVVLWGAVVAGVTAAAATTGNDTPASP